MTVTQAAGTNTFTVTPTSWTPVAAGGTTSCSGAAAANYSLSYVSGTATVQRKLVTVTPTSPTVTYGDSIPTISVLSYTGWKTGETQSVLTATPSCTTTYTSTTPVATTPTTQCASAAAANYSFSYPTGTVTIQRKAAVITAASPNRTYGDGVPAVTVYDSVALPVAREAMATAKGGVVPLKMLEQGVDAGAELAAGVSVAGRLPRSRETLVGLRGSESFEAVRGGE